jgi:two-component system chemotaxis sensor kinase CheA
MGRGVLLKLVVGCLAPLLAAVIAQSLFTISTERHALMAGLSAKAQAVGQLMVDVVGPSIAFDDRQAVGEGLGYVSQDPDFDYALAVKADGTVMGYRGAANRRVAREARFVAPQDAREAEFEGVVEVTMPVRAAGKTVGAVLVGFKTDRVRGEVSSLVLKAGLISLAGIGAAVLVVLLLARAIARKNRDMRLVLDTVEQAIVTVNPDGRLLDERSAVGARLFEAGGATLWEAVGQVDPKAGRWLEMGWAELVEGVMPFELCVDQLPHTIEQGARTWRVDYTALKDGEVIIKWLVVLSDITRELERQRAEAVGSDLMRLIEGLSKDRWGVATFISEAARLVKQICSHEATESLSRDLHTLKGISAMHGLESVSRLVHQLEDRLVEGHFDDLDRRRLESAWAGFENRLAFVSGATRGSVELTHADLEDVLARLQSVPGTEAVRARVQALTHEPVRLPLERAASQARALAKRLGRSELTVTVEPNGLRLPEQYGEFWSNFAHVVRNAVDHGIEPAEQRVSNGKPAGGAIVMRGLETPTGFCIEIEDDGQGIDFEALAMVARRAGLPATTSAELTALIFADGVSTRETVTELSGRGVGMGAMRRAVEVLGGRIDVSSTRGKGSKFRFSFDTVELGAARSDRAA